MGWSKRDDGSLHGTEAAKVVAVAMAGIEAEAQRRTRARLPAFAMLEGFVAALNLDGSREPFYAELRRIDELVVRRAKLSVADAAKPSLKEVRIDGRRAEAFVVAPWYAAFDEVAELFDAECDRAPTLRELLHFLADQLEGNDDGWLVRDADVVLTDRKKPRERKPEPVVPVLVTGDLPRVRHPKFGEGVVVSEAEDRLTVEFGQERRVLLRSFVTPVGN